MSDVAPARRILIIEDNRNLALGLRVNLEEIGHSVTVAHTLAEGREQLQRWQPELVVLDVSLPDGDGLEFTRQLREEGNATLILVLTAKTQQDTKLFGLRTGADDYLTKPFDLDELLVRIDVLFRRTHRGELPMRSAASDTVGLVHVDRQARVLRRQGEEIVVSRIAFDLLLALVARRGTVVSRQELMREVWGYDAGVISRTLDTHIFELRQLLEPNPTAPVHIRTVWRIGYRLEL